jgi:methionyl aminopeptidase
VAFETWSPAELDKMRASCRLAASVLDYIAPQVRAGVSTGELDRLCHEYIVEHGAYPSPLDYHGYPRSVCISLNEVVCHGIPGERKLRDGDILNIDVTTYRDGFHGDTSEMFVVGDIPEEAQRLIRVTRECLWLGIDQVGPGKHLGNIGAAIREHAEKKHGYGVVTQFCGHGIGRKFHTSPQVPHVSRANTGPRLVPGMTFTIEPMINQGTPDCEILKDGWTAVTRDRKLSAQAEHTVLVTETGHEVLTYRESSPRP